MEITFLIGNGFNTNLGLKTAYKDFYNTVLKPLVSHNSNEIISSINADYSTWSDLEFGLGQFTAKSKLKPEIFLSQKSEVDNLLYEYLRDEQTRIDIDSKNETELGRIASVTKNSLIRFPDFFPPVDQDTLTKTILNYRENVKFNIIDFNYTNVFDNLWDATLLKAADNTGTIASFTNAGRSYKYLLGDVLHVHGSIDLTPILGVDNAFQIANENWRSIPEFTKLMIKASMNNIAKQNRTSRTISVIQRSSLVCIYGMSIGQTDKTWWKEIATWLAGDGRRKLIIFKHCSNRGVFTRSVYEKDRIETEVKNTFKTNSDVSEKVWEGIVNNILVMDSATIFNYGTLIIES